MQNLRLIPNETTPHIGTFLKLDLPLESGSFVNKVFDYCIVRFFSLFNIRMICGCIGPGGATLYVLVPKDLLSAEEARARSTEYYNRLVEIWHKKMELRRKKQNKSPEKRGRPPTSPKKLRPQGLRYHDYTCQELNSVPKLMQMFKQLLGVLSRLSTRAAFAGELSELQQLFGETSPALAAIMKYAPPDGHSAPPAYHGRYLHTVIDPHHLPPFFSWEMLTVFRERCRELGVEAVDILPKEKLYVGPNVLGGKNFCCRVTNEMLKLAQERCNELDRDFHQPQFMHKLVVPFSSELWNSLYAKWEKNSDEPMEEQNALETASEIVHDITESLGTPSACTTAAYLGEYTANHAIFQITRPLWAMFALVDGLLRWYCKVEKEMRVEILCEGNGLFYDDSE